MKCVCLVGLFFFFLLVSCRENRDLTKLEHADSLMLVAPDSALTFLESLTSNEINSTSSSQALYALLLTQAKDKNCIPHSNDSLINIAVKYYDLKDDDDFLRAKSHYYLGRVYQDIGDDLAAVNEYLIAMPLAERIDDYNLICLLQGNLGYIYYQQALYDKADSLYIRAENLSIQEKDSSNLAIILTARANICVARKDSSKKKAIDYLERALIIAKSVNDDRVERIVINALGILYESLGNFAQALDYAKKGIALKRDTFKLAGYYLLQGGAYYKLNQYDSAVFYLKKSLLTDNLYTKAGAYSFLSDIAEKQGSLEDALCYKKSFLKNIDSVRLVENHTVELLSFEHDYRINSHIRKYQYFIKKYQYCVYILLGLLLFLAFYFEYRKRVYDNKSLFLSCENGLLHRKLANMTLIQEELTKKEKEIEKLQRLSATIEEDKCRIYVLNKQVDSLRKEKEEMFINLMRSSDTYMRLLALIEKRRIGDKCREQYNNDDWNLLLADINIFSNGFVDRLKQQYELLSLQDVRFCCLLRVGLSYVDIALVLDRTLDAMYKRRNAILFNKMNIQSKSCLLEELLKKV